MTTRDPDKQRTQRRRRLVLIAAMMVVVWILWTQWDAIRNAIGGPRGNEQTVSDVAGQPEVSQPAQPSDESESPRNDAEGRWAELMGQPPSWPAEFAEPSDCSAVEADLARICAVLDSRDYLSGIELPGGVCGLIQQASIELASRPPQVTSELKSYSTILSNVFHLFRVLGRERTRLLQQLVADEGVAAEPAAMALYRWLVSRESCARSGRTPLRREVLYDYGAFLFQTMGGQAYLRRRTPGTEALASFYALLLVDRAVEQNHNPHGIDLRPEIRRTRDLLSTEPLVFRERYLALLERMAARWEARGT
jgi:hypothetical protein